jgi:hypothetical protein
MQNQNDQAALDRKHEKPWLYNPSYASNVASLGQIQNLGPLNAVNYWY